MGRCELMYIEIKNASKNFIQNGSSFTAFQNVSLSIKKGEFICLLGPSGCGKSTLLNTLAGFEKISDGSICIDSKEVTSPSVKYVTIFQNYGLLPWRTVIKNVELGLEQLKIPKTQRAVIAKKYIDLVGLSEFVNSYPHQLSGGMQQRIAIARALSVDPEIIFMDEPFGALDTITRFKLQDDIRSIAKQNNKTIIFVTHDIEEAVYLADRIVVMTPNPGKIKSIVPVPIHGVRDRTSDNFISVRNMIFEIFNMKYEPNVDYVI
jgi:NitT/TauT family transport system ATP-binding protein